MRKCWMMNGCEEGDECAGGNRPVRPVWDGHVEGRAGGDSVWGDTSRELSHLR